jgi:predicted DNA-binding protein
MPHYKPIDDIKDFKVCVRLTERQRLRLEKLSNESAITQSNLIRHAIQSLLESGLPLLVRNQ